MKKLDHAVWEAANNEQANEATETPIIEASDVHIDGVDQPEAETVVTNVSEEIAVHDLELAAATVSQTEEEADTNTESEERVEAQPDEDDAEAEEDSEEDMTFAELIEQIPQVKKGIVLPGVIVRYDEDSVYVDIKHKSEGRVPINEFFLAGIDTEALDQAIADHTEFAVYVKSIRTNEFGNREVLLSKTMADYGRDRDKVHQFYKDQTPVVVKIDKLVQDGVIATYNNTVEIYLHRSQLAERPVDPKKLDSYLGKDIEILVTQFDQRRGRTRIAGSHRTLINRTRREWSKVFWENIAIGNIYRGKVRNLTNFGAFVDLGGADGLVHITELSWNRIKHPSDVVSVGDEIDVYIKSFDPEKKRISLGYRRIEDDPYHNAEFRYPMGSIVTGKVVRMFNFGAFIEIAPGVDGLCHISQISNQRLNKPQDVLSIGQEVECRILDVNSESRKISLSIRDVNPIDPPASEGEPVEGERSTGRRREGGRRGRRRDAGESAFPTSYTDSQADDGADLTVLNVYTDPIPATDAAEEDVSEPKEAVPAAAENDTVAEDTQDAADMSVEPNDSAESEPSEDPVAEEATVEEEPVA